MKKMRRIVNIMAIVTSVAGMMTGCSLFGDKSGNEGYQKGADMSGSCGDNLTFEYEAETGKLTIRGTGEMTSCPWSGYGGVSVRTVEFEEGITSLYNGAFYSQSELEGDIVLPSTVTYIDDFSFYGTQKLHSITIPQGVTYIGSYAFQRSGISGELNLPDSVTEIGEYCFDGCENLTGRLKLPASLKKIGRVAFGNCAGFTGDLVIPNSVEEIGDYAFNNCSGFNGSLVLSTSLTNIQENCFNYCENFTGDLIIPENVKCIEEKAFVHCGFDGKLVLPKKMDEIGDAAFSACENIKGEVLIPEGISRINSATFENCRNLTGVTFNSGLKYICDSSFARCKALSGELALPESLVGIGNRAFIDCSSLKGTLRLPESLEIIEAGAFNSCTGLTGELILPKGLLSVGSQAFYACSGFSGELILPDKLAVIGEQAFEECSGFQKVTAGSKSALTTIGNGAFRKCTSLQEADFSKLSIIPDYYEKDYDNRYASFPGNCLLKVNTNAEPVSQIWMARQDSAKAKSNGENQSAVGEGNEAMSEEPYYWTSGLNNTYFYGTDVNSDSRLYFENNTIILIINDKEYGSFAYEADANGTDTSIKCDGICFKDGAISELIYLYGYKISMVKAVMTHEDGSTEDVYFVDSQGFGDRETYLRITLEENLVYAFE